MATISPNNWAVFPGIFDSRSRSLEGDLTDSAHFIVGVPGPGSHGVKSFDAKPDARVVVGCGERSTWDLHFHSSFPSLHVLKFHYRGLVNVID